MKVYGPGGKKGVERKGRGLFARVLMAERPLLPVVEEVELGDPARREDFLTRVLVYHRWQALTAVGITPERLLRFHADHEYLVMTHSRAACRHMEHLLTLLEGYRQGPSLGLATGERVSPVATPSLEAEDPDAISGRYAGELMAAIEHRAAGHTEHTDETRRLTDDYEPEAGSTDQAEPVIRAIAAYRRGERPLAVPITRLRRYLWGHPGSRLRDPARL